MLKVIGNPPGSEPEYEWSFLDTDGNAKTQSISPSSLDSSSYVPFPHLNL